MWNYKGWANLRPAIPPYLYVLAWLGGGLAFLGRYGLHATFGELDWPIQVRSQAHLLPTTYPTRRQARVDDRSIKLTIY